MWIIVAAICIGVIAIFALPHVLITRTELPQPSGKWSVGTQDLAWDQVDRSHTIAIPIRVK